MAAISIFERIRGKANHLQEFFPGACVMLHLSDDRYEFKVDQNVTGCENDPDVGTRIWVTVKSGEYHNSNQPCSDDRIMLESPNKIDGDFCISIRYCEEYSPSIFPSLSTMIRSNNSVR